MTKRILSIVLALLMVINVFAITAFAAESDNHASWKLVCSNASPQPGDVLAVDVYLQADYVTNTFGALIVYDKNYYEPAESVEGNNIVIANDIVDYGNKTVIMSEKKSASQAAKLYDASYTDAMREQYGIAWFSFVFQASKFGDPTADEIPSYATMKKVATLKLKVKDTAASDGNGLIWMDPVYIQTANGSAKYTFVGRGSNVIVGQCTTEAKFGQTVDVSEAILYKAEEQPACQHTNTSVVGAVDATCTQAGYTGDTVCTDCGETIATGNVINALGHIEVVDQAVPATCQATGLTAGSHCSRCQAVIVAQQVVPVADHTPVDDAAVPATCQATGLTAGSHCSVCGTVLVAQEVTPLADHTAGDWQVVTPATCQATGTKAQYCTVCGALLATDEIALADHTPAVSEAVPATCTQPGLTEGSYCSVCGQTLVYQQEVAALGHDFGAWTVVTPATYTSVGTERRDCSRCDVYEERDIPMLEDTDADYSAVTAALANVPEDLSVYTAASVKALNDAIQAVEYGLPASQQATVDAYAADIQTAINNLKLIPTTLASYADLDDYIAKFVPATSNKTNGVYDADELAQIDELIASFDRELPSSEQATVDGYLTALRVAVAALTIDETKAVATFAVSTDKAVAEKDDIVTVSLKLKTNYPIYTMQVPVIYDATVFEVVAPTTVPKSYLTFTGSLADAYKLDGNFNPASSMYKRNSNPSYWSTQTQYKVAYATWAYDVSINNIPVTLEDGEVIATFQLKVISDVADTTGSIFLNSDWIKTATTKGGALAVGRTQGSIISVLDGTKYEIGQTFDLSEANAVVAINPSHEHTPGAWAVEDDKYVCRCTECNEIIDSKDLPLAEITEVQGTGTVDLGTTTVVKIAADPMVSKVRLLKVSNNGVVTQVSASENGVFTISYAFNATGAEQVYMVQYKLGSTWLDIDTISVNVVKPDTGNAAITAKENTGNITLGAVTKITLTTSGSIEKVRIINLTTGNTTDNVKTLSANIVKTATGYEITRQFAVTNGDLTVGVQYKTGGQWKNCGSFTMNVTKPAVATSAKVTAIQGNGTIIKGTPTVITVSTVSGKVDKVRILKIANNGVVTQVSESDNGVFTISCTFNPTGVEQFYKVQFKANDTWTDCINGDFSVNVLKEAPVAATAEVTAIDGDGTIVKGTATTITVATTGAVSKVRIVKIANNGEVTQVSASNNGVFTISYTFNATGAEQFYKVQYKTADGWLDCANGEFSVNVVKG